MNNFILSEFNEQLKKHQPLMYALLMTSKGLQNYPSESKK